MTLAALPLACLLFLTRPAAASAPTPAPSSAATTAVPTDQPAAAAYLLRVTNTQYGAIQVSADQGATWQLIGRVIRPAYETAPGAPSTLPKVLRASRYGIAFGVGGASQMKLLPDSKNGRRDRTAILVNVGPDDGLLKLLAPPADSPLQIVLNGKPIPLPTPYLPQDGDVLQFTVARTNVDASRIADVVTAVAAQYREEVISRLRSQNRKPVTGMLTVTAQLAPGETPGAVLFLIDGQIAAIQNRGPFTIRWNTHELTAGEHLIEVRALDTQGAILSRKKTLVVTDNRS